eukprot:374851-Prymnesium_polylepis.1
MTLDYERGRGLIQTVRAAGAFFTKLGLRDVTKLGSVKAHVKDLVEECGLESEPATACTPRMFKAMVQVIIPERYQDPYICERERVQVLCEGVGGCRIGEVAGGGDGHGLLANETCILVDPDASLPEDGRGALIREL